MGGKEGIYVDEECAEPLLRHSGKGGLKLGLAGRSEHLNPAPERLRRHSLSIAKAKQAAKSSAEQLFRNCSFTASYIKAWPALTSSEQKTRRMARALSSADCVIGRPLFGL